MHVVLIKYIVTVSSAMLLHYTLDLYTIYTIYLVVLPLSLSSRSMAHARAVGSIIAWLQCTIASCWSQLPSHFSCINHSFHALLHNPMTPMHRSRRLYQAGAGLHVLHTNMMQPAGTCITITCTGLILTLL